MNWSWLSCNTNSSILGGISHGGKTDPFSLEPCNRIICSRVDIVLLRIDLKGSGELVSLPLCTPRSSEVPSILVNFL